MNARERTCKAMHLEEADRVPLMCQLSIGHYFLHTGIDPVEIWCNSSAFAEAVVELQRRYRFDGILVNIAGRDPQWRSSVRKIVPADGGTTIEWRSQEKTFIPADDNPQYLLGDRRLADFEAIDPEELFYVEPWGLAGVTYRGGHEFEAEGEREFPPYQTDAVKAVLSRVEGEVSVHGEIFSPWSQFLELFGYQNGLLATMDDPSKVKQCLQRLVEGTGKLGSLLASEGIDALLISSAFAGASFISRSHYEAFVLPFEKQVIESIREHSDLPIYTHTCGAIGDRLDLMLETGTGGIDTLDPPPLGTVELKDAKRLLEGRAFIKGNIDPVNTLLKGTRQEVEEDARMRLEIAAPGGGYILSSACSVAPRTPPENIECLYEAVEKWGKYRSAKPATGEA